jgi:hypothetical protein
MSAPAAKHAQPWKNIGIRSYKKHLPGGELAFVFGAYRPACLWAWAAYWSGGSASGVENSFRRAKTEAYKRLARATGEGE